MRTWMAVGVGLLAGACQDPYELARQAKFAQLTGGCGVPLGTAESAVLPSSELVSEIVPCPAPDGGTPIPAGYVTIKGRGRLSVYGDQGDPWAANVVAEPGDCAPSSGDRSKSRAFWNEVYVTLRERRIVYNGSGLLRGCSGRRRAQTC